MCILIPCTALLIAVIKSSLQKHTGSEPYSQATEWLCVLSSSPAHLPTPAFSESVDAEEVTGQEC